MKIRMSKVVTALVAVTLIATVTTVGIIKGAGRPMTPRLAPIRIGTYPGQSFQVGDPLLPAPLPVIVPWELREPRRYEGLRVGALNGQGKEPILYKLIAAELHRQELRPPPARIEYYDWMLDLAEYPKGSPDWHPNKIRIYGWLAGITEAEEIPGGWHATINVTPLAECDWTACLVVSDEFKEEYVSQNGEIRLLQTIPRQHEWGGFVTCE